MFVQHIVVLAIAIALILGSHGSLGTRPVLKSSGVGSPNRTYTSFDDLGRLADAVLTVRSITIASFYELDSIQFSYALKNGSIYRPPTRGEGFTVPQTIPLAKDEYVAKIEGTTVYNESISQVFITINNPNEFKSRVYGPFGMTVGERNFTFEGYIMGIHGKTKQIVRNLGVYYLAPVTEQYFGSPIGTAFYENPDMRFPPVVKISKIFISHMHGNGVNSLRVEYQLLDGSTKLGEKNGGDYGDLTTISLGYGEDLIGLKVGVLRGLFSTNITSQLTFISRKKDGNTAVYGPFGQEGDIETTVNGHILGFTGTTNKFVLSLGVFYSV